MVFPHSAGLWSEPEGLSPDGGLYTPTNRKTHQAREPRGLSPSGGNSAAKSLFLEYSRAPWARCGVQGVTPCREPRGPSPSGGNFAANLLSLERPRAHRARYGVQGVTPCREPEGPSPDGGLHTPTNRKLHQTGEPWHPSCHGGKTPAKPHVSLRPCAPAARSPGLSP